MKVNKIKLTSLFEKEMSKREESALKGGGCLWCSCPCKYAGPKENENDDCYEGASTADNDKSEDGGWF